MPRTRSEPRQTVHTANRLVTRKVTCSREVPEGVVVSAHPASGEVPASDHDSQRWLWEPTAAEPMPVPVRENVTDSHDSEIAHTASFRTQYAHSTWIDPASLASPLGLLRVVVGLRSATWRGERARSLKGGQRCD